MSWKYKAAIGLGILLVLCWWYGRPFLLATRVAFVMCDVGQGDGLLIQHGSFQMVIDGGPDYQIIECLSRHIPLFDTKIELVVASHGDSDHIKGLEAVLSRYQVAEIWIVPLGKKTADFEAFGAAISKENSQGATVRYVAQGDVFELQPWLQATVLSPREELWGGSEGIQDLTETTLSADSSTKKNGEEWENDRSIVLKMMINGASLLLTGDIEKATEQALIKQGLISRVDILKVAHHGSKTSTIDAFLAKAQPEIAAISSGKNNKYGHPSPEVIAKLTKNQAKIYRTDQQGDVVLIFSEEGEVKEWKM